LAVNVIDFYRFGLIIVNGKQYTSDVVIFSDRVEHSWWRRDGHQLCSEDIAEVLDEKPDVLVVGTGASGLMKVLPEVRPSVETRGAKLIVEITDRACKLYNQLCHSRRVVAALHITC